MNYRPRQIETKLRNFAEHFKAILVAGARQVGKSTLLAHVFPGVRAITFDPLQDVFGARRDPDLFLDNFPPPLILDEIQFAPEILPALKRRVDRHEGPGQYFLSGSQQLALLRDVTESMAGRAGVLHLGPMTSLESAGLGAERPWLEHYLETPGELTGAIKRTIPSAGGLFPHLWRGLLPGTLDLPNEIIPDYFRSYVETYIERDVRRQGEIRNVTEFARFIGLAGALTAQEINTAHLGREIGVTPSTARHWLDMLSACYQWREIPAYSGNAVKRVSGKRKGLVGDSGLACWLGRISSPDALASSPSLGALFETFVLNGLLAQADVMPMPPQAWHWRTVGGAEVDLVLERDGKLYPIEIRCKTQLTRHDTRGIRAFRETYGGKVQPGVIVYAGKETYRLSDCAVAVPWNAC